MILKNLLNITYKTNLSIRVKPFKKNHNYDFPLQPKSQLSQVWPIATYCKVQIRNEGLAVETDVSTCTLIRRINEL